MPPSVSILIPCHNAEPWLAEALDSTRDQGDAIEVLVYDDGSTDSSMDIVRDFPEVGLMAATTNKGGNVARNRLLKAASGAWIQYLDADDALMAGKIQADREAIEKYEAADIILSPTPRYYQAKKELETLRQDPEPDLWARWLAWRMPQTGGFLWRASSLRALGGWDETLPDCQDYALSIKALKEGVPCVERTGPGAIYRQWSDGTVSKKKVKDVISHRWAMTVDALEWLEARNQLEPKRQAAAQQAFFEMVRSLAPIDHDLAMEHYHEARALWGIRAVGTAAPFHYRIAFNTLGFDRAERLARWLRP